MFWPETLLFWFTALIVLFLATAVEKNKNKKHSMLPAQHQTADKVSHSLDNIFKYSATKVSDINLRSW